MSAIDFESNTLELGDICWALEVGGVKYMVDYIIERKTLSDLEASIIDKRYVEQKFRLGKCGLRNLIYLVEAQPQKGDVRLPEIADTQLGSFLLHRSRSDDETLQYLGRIHAHFQALLREGKVGELVRRVTLAQFSERVAKHKNLVLQDHFARLLLQIRGCSPEKAAAVVAKYETPRALIDHIGSLLAGDALDALAGLQTATGRRLGRALAESIVAAFTQDNPLAELPRSHSASASQEQND